jgi:hypothetical protein
MMTIGLFVWTIGDVVSLAAVGFFVLCFIVMLTLDAISNIKRRFRR